jgi:uncharacterized protein (TIGR02246 family)
VRARIAPAAGVALFVLAACSPSRDTQATADTAAPVSPVAATTDPGAVRRSIDSLNADAAQALERGDTTAMVAHYTDDAIVMMPNMPAFRGRDAYRSGVARMLKEMSVTDAAFTTEDVMVSGDLAVETGTYAMTMQPRRGGAMKDTGKYITVWRRQSDGSWKIVRDISNADPSGKT